MLLVNHALARGTPAIFVIFVVSRGSSSKTLVLLVRMQIRHFRHFRQKPPFSGGTKARFIKSTVFGTPKSAQKNPPGKSPAKSSKIYTTKILQHMSADCPGQEKFSGYFLSVAVVQEFFFPALTTFTLSESCRIAQPPEPLPDPLPDMWVPPDNDVEDKEARSAF